MLLHVCVCAYMPPAIHSYRDTVANSMPYSQAIAVATMTLKVDIAIVYWVVNLYIKTNAATYTLTLCNNIMYMDS